MIFQSRYSPSWVFSNRFKRQHHITNVVSEVANSTTVLHGTRIGRWSNNNLVPRVFLRRGEDGPILSSAEKNPGNEVGPIT